jgi:hypothetical protein
MLCPREEELRTAESRKAGNRLRLHLRRRRLRRHLHQAVQWPAQVLVTLPVGAGVPPLIAASTRTPTNRASLPLLLSQTRGWPSLPLALQPFFSVTRATRALHRTT